MKMQAIKLDEAYEPRYERLHLLFNVLQIYSVLMYCFNENELKT